MPEKAPGDSQAFPRENSVRRVGVAQIVKPNIIGQSGAASNAVPNTIDISARAVRIVMRWKNVMLAFSFSKLF